MKKFNKEELHISHSSQIINRVIKLRRVRWTERVAWSEKMRNAYKILVGKPEGKRPAEGLRRSARAYLCVRACVHIPCFQT